MLAEVHIHLTFNGKRCCLLLPGLHAPLLPISWFRHTLYFTCSSLLSLQSSRTSDAICKPHRQRLSYTPEPAGKTRDRFKLEPFRSAVRARRGKWKQHFVMREANSRRRLQRPGRTERVKRGQSSLEKCLLSLLPTFCWACLFFWYWVVWAACIFWKLIIQQLFPLLLLCSILRVVFSLSL